MQYSCSVPRKSEACRRSGCPINISLEMIGDRWSLLIVRDMLLRGFRTYQQFLNSDEGIATNILADRLRRLERGGIVSTSRDPIDRRKLVYTLTQKGLDLGPVLLELALWSARYEATDASPAMIQKFAKNREVFLAEIRRKWQQAQKITSSIHGSHLRPIDTSHLQYGQHSPVQGGIPRKSRSS